MANHYAKNPLEVFVRSGGQTRRLLLAGGLSRPGLAAARRGEWRDVFSHDVFGSSEVPTTVVAVSVYPEDTMADLQRKIYVATTDAKNETGPGVPPTHQHLTYSTGGLDREVPYAVTMDGAPVPINIEDMLGSGGSDMASQPPPLKIDPEMEERRSEITITAHDTTMEVSPGIFIKSVTVVDLRELTARVLPAMLTDTLRFDRLYYTALKYWPLLTPEILRDTCRGEISDTAEPLEAVAVRLEAEKTIADRVYAFSAIDANVRKPVSVTAAAIVRNAPRAGHVAVRNVYDALPLGTAESSTKGQDGIKKPGAVGAALRYEVYNANNLIVPIISTKRWRGYAALVASATGAANDDNNALEWFLSHPPAVNAVHYALARGSTVMRVLESGQYSVEANWREDDRMSFEGVTQHIAAVSAPVVKAINALGAVALPLGGRLGSIKMQKHDSVAAADSATSLYVNREGSSGCSERGCTQSFGAITASAFWGVAVTSAGFRDLKEHWRSYERAGIISIKGLQQSGAFTFQFRKGIVAPDVTIFTSGVPAPAPAAAGRTVHIHHRATDVRVEVVAAQGLAEFELIRRYIFAFFEYARKMIPGLVVNARAGPPLSEGDEKLRGPGTRRLRRLQERDPVLFDLKKHNANATVYSVLCQAQRQPHAYTEAERNALPAARQKKLTKYMNFTDKTPAYYECPTTEYPFLSFRAGVHPLGFCLPCCKKAAPPPNSRAAAINAACLQMGPDSPCKDMKNVAEGSGSLAAARHVLSYGKPIPVGRISDLPAIVANELFGSGVLPLCAIGVEQHSPAVPRAGFLYSIAAAVADANAPAPVSSVIAAFCRYLASAPRAYLTLGGGAATAFASASELASVLTSAFVRNSPTFSQLNLIGNGNDRSWEAIVASLVQRCFGCDVVRLSDPAGTGNVAVEPCTGISSGAPLVLVVSSPAGTYPVFAADTREYLRTPIANRARLPPAALLRVFPAAHPVTRKIHAVLAVRTRTHLPIDIPLVIAVFGAKNLTYLINSSDRCYGVLIPAAALLSGQPAGSSVFIPVVPQAVGVVGGAGVYGPRPRQGYPRAALDAAVARLNAYIGKRAPEYDTVAPSARLQMKGADIGFVAGGQRYWGVGAPANIDVNIPVINVPYDPLTVDEALWKANKKSLPEFKLAAEAFSINHLYRLFEAEFAAALRRETNAPLRAKLREVIAGTPTPAALRAAGLSDADVVALRNISLGEFDKLRFEFDQTTLARLRAMEDHDKVAVAVREFMKPHVVLIDAKEISNSVTGSSSTVVSANNLYAACSLETSIRRDTCVNGRLRVPAEKFDDLADILAADIRNPYKAADIALSAAGVFDETRFIERDDEIITTTPFNVL